MAIDQRLNQIQALQQEVREMHDNLRRSGGGGRGGSGNEDGMMDRRMTRLENQSDKIADRMDVHGTTLGRVETQVAVLAERVSHLPGKGFVVTTALAIVAAVTAIITFGEKLQSLIK